MNRLFLPALALYLGALSTPAFAYLDPASGSAFMSAVIGIFVAAGVLVKTYWYRLKRMVGLGKARKDEANSTPTVAPNSRSDGEG